jgi:hypothetical protein
VIEVEPTLAFMADVYRLTAEGGPASPRFRAYVEAGAERVPVHGYNPMTSKDVLPTIEALLAIDGEARLGAAANRVAAELGFTDDVAMHLTVATPGMWTDRLATEVEHRLLLRDPGGVLLWFDEPVLVEQLDAAIVAQAVRLVSFHRQGPPITLADAVAQEGEALARAGHLGEHDGAAAEALAVLEHDTDLPTMVAFLYGDDAARTMGFTPLGLDLHAGERHAVALARAHRR